MTIPSGALRFNSDSRKLEYYNGEAWWQIDSFTPDSATGGARGLWAGGTNPTNIIDYVNISSTGNAIDFGDLIAATQSSSALSNSTRGVFGGGITSPLSPVTNVIQYITISSTGDAVDFGDLSVGKSNLSACSNSTRGVFAGGITPTAINVIEYITIESTGNAQDFGDLSVNKSNLSACSSSTRGIFGGGFTPTPTLTLLNVIEYITISSTGNVQDFGDLIEGKNNLRACSSSTRGVFAGGGVLITAVNTIEYITLASTGNAQDFGDLSIPNVGVGACSSSTRGVFGGGFTPTPAPATRTNVIEYVTIMSTGNAIDFGDLTVGRNGAGTCSNGHGGL